MSRTLPDSLTTWDVQAVGVFKNGNCRPGSLEGAGPLRGRGSSSSWFSSGICVADPVQVSVRLPLSVDVPLPYQVVRGEQVELRGSVYNQQPDSVTVASTPRLGSASCV